MLCGKGIKDQIFNTGLKVFHEASLDGFKTVGLCGEGQTQHRPGSVQGSPVDVMLFTMSSAGKTSAHTNTEG